MTRSMKYLPLIAVLAGTVLAGPARAGNASVESAMQSFGDVSMFYQGLLNTGVINELNENQHYTVFAPINSAFYEVHPNAYPCFYAVECRPQIAGVLRDHIIVGGHDLKDLASYGQGIQTMGSRPVFVSEPYVGQYQVDGKTILSETEVNGNVIYRINGVVARPQELTPFSAVNYVPAPGETVTKKTVTTTTYGPGTTYPAGTMVVEPPAAVQPDETQRTTVIHTYTTEQ